MVRLLMARKRAVKTTSKIELPPGAVIRGMLTLTTASSGVSSIQVHGFGGPNASLVAKKNSVEFILPGTTFADVSPGIQYVAWDGDQFVLRPTLESVLEYSDLTLVGHVEIPVQDPPATTSFKPPLSSLTREATNQLLHRLDGKHWPTITAMRVKKYYSPDSPVPPPTPEQLLSMIRWYASMVFGTEADQYGQFKEDRRYPAWLSHLADRTILRVLSAVEKLDGGDPEALLLAYHGVEKNRIKQDLKAMLSEIRSQYELGIAPSQRKNVPSSIQTAEPPATPQPSLLQQESVAEQLKRLQADCRLTAQEMADALRIDLRSIFRHLGGKALPRRRHLAAYERLFSDKLGKSVTLRSS
jgi:hypothetical protein